jgi:hypothetical protein
MRSAERFVVRMVSHASGAGSPPPERSRKSSSRCLRIHPRTRPLCSFHADSELCKSHAASSISIDRRIGSDAARYIGSRTHRDKETGSATVIESSSVQPGSHLSFASPDGIVAILLDTAPSPKRLTPLWGFNLIAASISAHETGTVLLIYCILSLRFSRQLTL